eukprot:EG_transcript_32233
MDVQWFADDVDTAFTAFLKQTPDSLKRYSDAIASLNSDNATGASIPTDLASPLIESIATAELPEPLVEKSNDFAEGSSRMIPYFNMNNLLGSLGPRDDGACPCPGQ